MNGDRIVEPALFKQLVELRESNQETTIAVTRVSNPTEYGMITLQDAHVNDLIEKPARHQVSSKLVNVGAYAFGPEIFSAIRRSDQHGELQLTGVLADSLDDHPVRAVTYDGLWVDLTKPWDLITATEELLLTNETQHADSARIHDDSTVEDLTAIGEDVQLAPGARVLQGSALGENVRVGANSVLSNTVVLPDATIGRGTVLENCIVGANTHVGPNVTTERSETDISINGTQYEDVAFGGVIGDNATVAGGVTIQPGTILGNHTKVDAGATISGTIEDGARIVR